MASHTNLPSRALTRSSPQCDLRELSQCWVHTTPSSLRIQHGAACTIVVMRRLLAELRAKYCDVILSADNIARNAVLAGVTESDADKALKIASTIPVNVKGPNIAFETIMSCKIMRDTAFKGSSYFDKIWPPRATWDGLEGQSLGHHVAKCFDTAPNSETFMFFSLRYTSQNPDMTLSDLKSFTLPFRRRISIRTRNGQTINRVATAACYTCAAVIKLSKTGFDTVRLFTESFREVLPAKTQLPHAKFKIEKSSEYLLFYVCCPQDLEQMVKASTIPRGLPFNQAPRAVYGVWEAMAEKLTAKKAAPETKVSSAMPKSVVVKPTGLAGSSMSASASQQLPTQAKGTTESTTKPPPKSPPMLTEAALANPGRRRPAHQLSFQGPQPQSQSAPQLPTLPTTPVIQHGANAGPSLLEPWPSSRPQHRPQPASRAPVPDTTPATQSQPKAVEPSKEVELPSSPDFPVASPTNSTRDNKEVDVTARDIAAPEVHPSRRALIQEANPTQLPRTEEYQAPRFSPPSQPASHNRLGGSRGMPPPMDSDRRGNFSPRSPRDFPRRSRSPPRQPSNRDYRSNRDWGYNNRDYGRYNSRPRGDNYRHHEGDRRGYDDRYPRPRHSSNRGNVRGRSQGPALNYDDRRDHQWDNNRSQGSSYRRSRSPARRRSRSPARQSRSPARRH